MRGWDSRGAGRATENPALAAADAAAAGTLTTRWLCPVARVVFSCTFSGSISKCFPGSHTRPLRRPGGREEAESPRPLSRLSCAPRGAFPPLVCNPRVPLPAPAGGAGGGRGGHALQGQGPAEPQPRPDTAPPPRRPCGSLLPPPGARAALHHRLQEARRPRRGPHFTPRPSDPRTQTPGPFAVSATGQAPPGVGTAVPRPLTIRGMSPQPLLGAVSLPRLCLRDGQAPVLGAGCLAQPPGSARAGLGILSRGSVAPGEGRRAAGSGQRPSMDGPVRGPAAQPSGPPAARSLSHQARSCLWCQPQRWACLAAL